MTWHDLAPLLTLAQEGQAPPPTQEDPFAFMRLMFPLVVMFVLAWILLIRPQKKKEQELRQMVNNLKEKDHVVTIGGIHGVVTNVRRDLDQVIIRVDETTGTKIHVGMSAIARVILDEAEEAEKQDNKSKK